MIPKREEEEDEAEEFDNSALFEKDDFIDVSRVLCIKMPCYAFNVFCSYITKPLSLNCCHYHYHN